MVPLQASAVSVQVPSVLQKIELAPVSFSKPLRHWYAMTSLTVYVACAVLVCSALAPGPAGAVHVTAAEYKWMINKGACQGRSPAVIYA